MPMISHGRISGAPTSPPTAARPRNRNRVSPNAASVPSTRHTGATIARDDDGVHQRLAEQLVAEGVAVPMERDALQREREDVRVVEAEQDEDHERPEQQRGTRRPRKTRHAHVAPAARARTLAGRRDRESPAATARSATPVATVLRPLARLHLGPRGDPRVAVRGRARGDRVLQVERRVERGLLDQLRRARGPAPSAFATW